MPCSPRSPSRCPGCSAGSPMCTGPPPRSWFSPLSRSASPPSRSSVAGPEADHTDDADEDDHHADQRPEDLIAPLAAVLPLLAAAPRQVLDQEIYLAGSPDRAD